jgi:F420-dependent methylenetetrahydromethanopterin dehydrogenase
MRLYPAFTVLVVVPDSELRRSIAFALEAEGYAIEQHCLLADAVRASAGPDVICIVVDENAVAGRSAAGAILEASEKPLVLLVDKLRAAPGTKGVTILTKPLLGQLLVETVAEMIPSRMPLPALRSFP